MRASICLLAAVAICCPLHATAQVAATPGDRVRVQSRDGAVLVGVISAVSSDVIVLSQGVAGQDLAIPLAGTEGIERSLGRRRRFGRNFGVTLGVSAAAFGLASALAWQPCRETSITCLHPIESRTGAFGFGLAGGALIGLPLGVIVGLVAKSEEWEPIFVPGSQSAKISITPFVGSQFGVVGSISLGAR